MYGLFTSEAHLLEACMEYLPISVIAFVACAVRDSINAFVYGCGNFKFNFALAILDGVVARIGLSLLLGLAFGFAEDILNGLDYENRKIILVTCHRRENYGQPMTNIMTSLRRIADANPDCELVYPVHLSPVVQEAARKHLSNHERIHLIAPLSVDEMHNLMARCYLVLTDSGGLQEEAPALGKPVLVMRKETERPEAVQAGTVKLAGVEEEDIFSMACELLRDKAAYDKMAHAVNPYGDGQACRRIADAIEWHFGLRETPPEEF